MDRLAQYTIRVNRTYQCTACVLRGQWSLYHPRRRAQQPYYYHRWHNHQERRSRNR